MNKQIKEDLDKVKERIESMSDSEKKSKMLKDIEKKKESNTVLK